MRKKSEGKITKGTDDDSESTGVPISPAEMGSGRTEYYGMHNKNFNAAFIGTRKGCGHICIGWSELGNLSDIPNKSKLKTLHRHTYPNVSSNDRDNDVNEIWLFVHKMRPGDLVVFIDDANEGNESIHIGEVVSYYNYSTTFRVRNTNYPHNRMVKWLMHLSYNQMDVLGLKPEEFFCIEHEYIKPGLRSTDERAIWDLGNYEGTIYDLLDKQHDEQIDSGYFEGMENIEEDT